MRSLRPTLFKAAMTFLGWAVALLLFFPILWTVLTSFKSEVEAIAFPPAFWPSGWTLENYFEVQERSEYFGHFLNSVALSLGSTVIGMLIAIPAAWSMAFQPAASTRHVLMWMLSTKMMPAVGALVPVFLIFKSVGLLDTLPGITLIVLVGNLPIMVWMLYTYFKEIPVDILEAARMDGAELWNEIVHVLLPMAVPGIASTLLLNVILAWNEAFWTITLTSGRAGTLTAFISSFSSPQGLFLAKLSAASLLAIAPILLLGWFSQKQLVRGLTFGAVK
jgi:sorbitol/mannitol transport system permease protein